ncbi:MAG: hypothetical protein RPU64_05010 [Candidatus Sedimenticola sp. (ex Thyasira tokunagai)]
MRYGAFRPLDPAAQGDPRMKQGQTFSEQSYRAVVPPTSEPVYSSSPSPSQESSLYGRAPIATPGYKFRQLPGKDETPSDIPKFRPDSQSGKSPYAWGGGDGRWSQGVLGPAPLFRPDEEAEEKLPPPSPPQHQWPVPGTVTGGYPVNPYPHRYQRGGYGGPFPMGGGFPMRSFMPW